MKEGLVHWHPWRHWHYVRNGETLCGAFDYTGKINQYRLNDDPRPICPGFRKFLKTD